MHHQKKSVMNKLSILLKERISETLSSLSIPLKDFSLTPTKNLQFGDLSTNIAEDIMFYDGG